MYIKSRIDRIEREISVAQKHSAGEEDIYDAITIVLVDGTGEGNDSPLCVLLTKKEQYKALPGEQYLLKSLDEYDSHEYQDQNK